MYTHIRPNAAPSATLVGRPGTPGPCEKTRLRKSLTRARHRAAITRHRLEELEGQVARARETLERHRADARAAERMLLELAPEEIANVHDVSKGAVPR